MIAYGAAEPWSSSPRSAPTSASVYVWPLMSIVPD
jgi:hypothetical protein